MRILVTGASGFVGKHLCKYLIRKGFDVTGASRQSGMPDLGSGDWGRWLDGLGHFDAIIHLAARVHRMSDVGQDSEELGAIYRRKNTEATLSLARAASDRGAKKFVFLSSIKVLGEGSQKPYESRQEPNPQDPYSKSKAEAEKALCELSKDSRMDISVIRVPLVYGPGVRANLLQLLTAVRRGIPLPLKTIQNKRSLVYVDNLSDFIASVLRAPCEGLSIWHVSDDLDLSTPELIALIGKSLNRKPLMFPFPLVLLRFALSLVGRGYVISRLTESLQVDIEDTKQRLHWKPPFTPEEGFKKSFGEPR